MSSELLIFYEKVRRECEKRGVTLRDYGNGVAFMPAVARDGSGWLANKLTCEILKNDKWIKHTFFRKTSPARIARNLRDTA